ncbi:MAG: hypothetical protein DCC71_19825, partial [Proteobacteria bacterium]
MDEAAKGMCMKRRIRAILVSSSTAALLAGCAALPLGSPQPPAEPPPLDAADTNATRTYLGLAAVRENGADWAGALDRIDKALAQQPASRSALLRRAQILLISGAPDLDKPREILTRAGDEGGDALVARAWLEWAEGAHEAALATAQRAAEAGADDARVQWLAARLLGEHGSPEAAL